MNVSVLKLNQNYEPLEIINWKEALKLVFLEKAEAIKIYDIKIHTPNQEFNVPAIIRLFKQFKKPRKKIRFNKRNVFIRDNYMCQYCGLEDDKLTIDHIVPKVKGGRTEWTNVVACCVDCNRKKRDKSLKEVGMKLRKKPIEPDWMPLSIPNNIPDMWKDYYFFK